MDRVDLYRRFAARFHAGKKIRGAAEAQVDSAGAALGIVWPESYRRFILDRGAVWTPSILDMIVEQKADFSDVQQFLTPKQSVAETRRWRPESVAAWLAIANDCGGNWLGFRDLPSSPPRPDDAPVWRFDLEEGTVAEEAPSFDGWLERFLAL